MLAPELRKAFVLAGDATFTVVGKTTRFTYRVRAKKNGDVYWVHVLRGPNNEEDYTFFGGITKEGKFFRSPKSPITRDAQSVRTFAWIWNHLESAAFEFHHSGRCGRCGRLLTDPESIRTGLGPICNGRG